MDELNSGAFEVLVNAEELGVFSGVSGQISDDAERAGSIHRRGRGFAQRAVTNPMQTNPNDEDIVFAELATGASWTIAI